jgi:hypothetical protein
VSQGYGSAEGAPLPPLPPGQPADRLLRALENLSRKVAPSLETGGAYEAWRPVTLTNIGDTFFFDTENNEVTMLTIQVFTGEVKIGLWDGRGQPSPPIPTWDLAVIGVPVHIPLATKARQVTLWAVAAGTTASFFIHSPAH